MGERGRGWGVVEGGGGEQRLPALWAGRARIPVEAQVHLPERALFSVSGDDEERVVTMPNRCHPLVRSGCLQRFRRLSAHCFGGDQFLSDHGLGSIRRQGELEEGDEIAARLVVADAA